jgi:hypothetical protein
MYRRWFRKALVRTPSADGEHVRGFLMFPLIGAILCAGCGGSTTSPSPSGNQAIVTSGPNVLPMIVNLGPTGNADNIAFASVTVCVPGDPSRCQTIDGIQVDTGSSGLRILSSALSLSLPQRTDSSGNPIVECFQFVASYSWGPIQTADVQIAGEQVRSVPIQVIGSPAFSTVPDSCSSSGASGNTLQTFGANGLLGVSVFRQDCGSPCAFAGASNPNFYFACPPSGCQPTVMSLAQQVPNPVWLFPTDNNGVVVQLPSVASAGEAVVSGSLVFGIGTQTNNALAGAKVIPVDANGLFTTTYQGRSYSGSILDTGSDALYFLDSGTTGLPLCRDASFYYCPASPQNLSATIPGANGMTNTIAFSVANADALFVNPALSAFSNLAGPNVGSFDWGLPFFFGRRVLFAIESQSTSGGPGPYVAY